MTTTTFQTARRGSALIAATLLLAGCTAAPAGLGGLFSPGAPAAGAPPPSAYAPGTGVAPEAANGFGEAPAAGAVATASRAEQACVEQGRSQGLEVRQVVGSRAVGGSDGASDGRDVMLQVARAGQVYEVRCSYSGDSDAARIMML